MMTKNASAAVLYAASNNDLSDGDNLSGDDEIDAALKLDDLTKTRAAKAE